MSDVGLKKITKRLYKSLDRDNLVQDTTDYLRGLLKVDRVILYYFYCRWQGQVTFESISSLEYSILGSTGADNCFNGEYAALYETGRIRAIADIETANIDQCHRDFLRSIHVKSNLAVPILTAKGLWGLLIAHNCHAQRIWLNTDIEVMKNAAIKIAQSSVIHA